MCGFADGARMRADNAIDTKGMVELAGVLGQLSQLHILDVSRTFRLLKSALVRLHLSWCGEKCANCAAGSESDFFARFVRTRMRCVCTQAMRSAPVVRQRSPAGSARWRSCRSCIFTVRLCCTVAGTCALAGYEACRCWHWDRASDLSRFFVCLPAGRVC